MEAGVRRFVEIYGFIHGPLVVALCVFGISTNLVNIIVLTRRHMIGPTNVLLTGLSVAQLLLLINYLIYTSYVIMDTLCNRATKTYGWLSYLLLNVNLNLIFHTIGLVHTTMLAVFRYAAVAFPTKSKKLVSVRGAKSVVLIAFAAVPLVCSSFYPNSIVVQRNLTNANFTACPQWTADDEYGQFVYGLRYSDRETLRDYNFWFFGTVCKLLPCLLLVVLSALLVRELSLVRQRRERLKKQKLQKASRAEHHHRQITIMLVGIVLLFVAVELPQGAMNMLSAILKDRFISIYTSMGDFFEMMTVLYSSVNFILYCSMSSQFRTTFKFLFVVPCCRLIGCREWSNALAMADNRRGSSKSTVVTDAMRTQGEALIDTAV